MTGNGEQTRTRPPVKPPAPLRVVIAAGGTGGHLSPALAALAALRAQGPVAARWIGGTWGGERDAARRAEVPFIPIATGKLRRYFSWQTPPDLLRVPLGVVQAYRALGGWRPDVVFSTGGYVAVPTVIAAARRGIPTLTHEQTAQIGLANRIASRYADVLALSFPVADAGSTVGKARVIVTGNPVRQEIFGGDAAAGCARFGLTPDLPTIYVTGGARGSTPINERVRDALPDLLPWVQIIHATGPTEANGDYPRMQAVREALPETLRRRYTVVESVREELRDVYALASLVVGRSGAGTVAELAALGKPSLLIPLPGTGGDEATKNARVLADADAATLRPQAEVTGASLAKDVLALVRDPERLARMGAAARAIAPADAAGTLAAAIIALARKEPPGAAGKGGLGCRA